MADNPPNNYQLTPRNSSICRIAKPSPEFYSVFTQEDILGIIHGLENRREIPLKYAYKGKGAKIWNNFYLKYIIPTWYRTSNVEIDLLKDNFVYLNGENQADKQINIVDVGAGNSYPVKAFVNRLQKLGRIRKYIACDISADLLAVSRKNFQKWFPKIEYADYQIDIEKDTLPANILHQENIVNIFLHLGVTIANHTNRNKVWQNFRNSMGKDDLLVFTNEIGASSQWDGIARGGCKYHAEAVYKWMKQNIGIKNHDCELVRKYDSTTDSIVANLKFRQNYKIDFSELPTNKTVEINSDEEITIWKHHKFQISEVIQEIEQAGLQVVHYSTNKYSSHLMVICQKKV